MDKEKICFSEIYIDAGNDECIYTVDELQALLMKKFLRQKLKKMYIDLNGYLESLDLDAHKIDLSYMGGATLLVFEEECIQFLFHGEGMFCCRCFPVSHLTVTERQDYPPDDLWLNERYVHDVSTDFILPYENQVVSEIIVKGTNTWGFSQPWFDSEKAALLAWQGKLPNYIDFQLENGNHLWFQGCPIEYYVLGIHEN